MSINDKIKKNIVNPTADSRGVTNLTGVIKSINEAGNTCEVSYSKFDGKKQIKSGVPLVLTNKGCLDWFPKVGENVLVQEKNNVLTIIGPAFSDYGQIRQGNKLKQDVLTNTYVDTMGGYIF